jgi:hypothetical protein
MVLAVLLKLTVVCLRGNRRCYSLSMSLRARLQSSENEQKQKPPFRRHNVPVSASPSTFPLETTRRIVRIQALTLVRMSVEAVVSLGAAWMARSPALLGFGGDSAVELFSAAVVLWRFYSPCRGDHAERQAARTAGGLLFVLAAFVAIASVLALVGHVEAPVRVPLESCCSSLRQWPCLGWRSKRGNFQRLPPAQR